MKYFIKEPLLKNINKTARTFKEAGISPVSALATIASLALSLTYLLSSRNKKVGSVKQEVKKQNPTKLTEQSSTTDNTYFEAAPRAISGSHRNFREYAHTGNGAIIKKGSQFAIGSAALLSIMYLISKRK